VLTGWITFKPAEPVFHVQARTEVVQIYTDRHIATSGLVFPSALLWYRGRWVPVGDVRVELGDSVLVELRRVASSTLDVQLRSIKPGAGAGLLKRDERLIGKLGGTVEFRVPLNGREYLFPFYTRRVQVGTIVGFVTDQRKPLLRSGELRFTDRTIFGARFPAGSRELPLGSSVEIPAPARAVSTDSGSALVLVDGQMGMSVSVTLQAAHARISYDVRKERLTTPLVQRVKNDPVIALLWIPLLFLLVQPVASVFADVVKKRAERLLLTRA
jgi:hypothetical protein